MLRGLKRVCVWMLGVALSQAAQAQAAKRPVTVLDSIESTGFPGGELGSAFGSFIPAPFSPDRSQFVFAIQKPELARNAVVGQILRFRSGEVFHNPRPEVVATFVSTSNHPPATDLRWRNDDTVLLRGEHPGEVTQVHEVNVETRAARALTRSPTPVQAYSLTADRSRLIYLAEMPIDADEFRRRAAEGFVVTQPVYDLLAGRWTQPAEDHPQVLTLVSLRDGRERVLSGAPLGGCLAPLEPSPNGRFMLFDCYPMSGLTDELSYFTQWARDSGLGLRFRMAVDLDRGQVFPVYFDTSALQQTETWSSDGNTLVIGNAILPLALLSDADRAAGRTPRGTFAVHLETGTPRAATAREAARAARARPSFMAVEAATPGELRIEVEQGLNTPRRVVARKGSQYAMIFDPNPQFAKLEFGRVEATRWRAADGEWTGGLYHPVGHVAGTRYPLVIQTHGFNDGHFEIDGFSTSSYAAQALAGRGIMVLQFGAPQSEFLVNGRPDEARIEARGIEAAIEALDACGLIDRRRIGLQGFSRSTLAVRYFLTHHRVPVAAALISDGVDYSYLGYVFLPTARYGGFEKMNGGIPIGEGLRLWQERVPTLNADKIVAPLRIEGMGVDGVPIGAMSQWELYGLLRRLGRPVELIAYPWGAHELVRPRERLTSQGGAVDWFAFWLQDHQDPDPAKSAQYRRWQAMRATRQEH